MSPVANPLQRQALALAPFSGSRTFTGSPANSAFASPAQLQSDSPPKDMSRGGMASVPPVRDLSVVNRHADNRGAATPGGAGRQPVVPVKAGPLPDFEETHAPTEQELVDAAVKARNAQYEPPTFEPPTKETRPFILADKGGYRTAKGNRAWLMSVERMVQNSDPYPSGTPGEGGMSRARSAARVWAGYLYTLPEVKAFLDVLSKTEGSVDNGYLTSHYPGPPSKDYSILPSDGPRGRYQIEPGGNTHFGTNWYSRKDFGPVTQDLVAITLLVKDGAIDRLLAGDLRGAFSAASRTFSSIPMGATENYSGYVGKTWSPDTGPNPARQRTGANFDELPGIFLSRLNARRTEFRNAQAAWEKSKALPWAFISPFRWHNFGMRGF